MSTIRYILNWVWSLLYRPAPDIEEVLEWYDEAWDELSDMDKMDWNQASLYLALLRGDYDE